MRSRGSTAVHALLALGVLLAVGATPARADHDDDDRHWHGHRWGRHGHHRYWNDRQAYWYGGPSYYYYEPRREYYYDAPRVYVPPPPAPSFGLNLVFPIH